MHEKEFHRLVVYYNYSGELIPYSDQTFKDNLIPDILISNSLIGLKLGKKYIISISDDNCTAIGIIKEFEANEWIRKEIIEVKKFNILLNNKNKTNNRICKTPPPDFMIIDPLKWDLVMSTINIGMYPLFTGPTGCGKAQPLDAKILTPNGWKLMKDIKIGNNIITQSGKTTKIIGVYPQGKKEIFEVIFSDGSSTRCCKEHLWSVKDRKTRNKYKKINNKKIKIETDYFITSLDEIMKDIKIGEYKNYSIPICQPIQFKKNILPFDPYALGLLLGDGSFAGKSINYSSEDTELVDALIKACKIFNCTLKINSKKNFFIEYRLTSNKGQINELLIILKNLGLMNTKSETKFIPDIYLRSSISDRLALLQGLMDTDGSTRGIGTTFHTSSPQLRDGIIELVRSLGGIAKFNCKIPKYKYKGKIIEGKKHYNVSINLPKFNPFRLIRKHKKYTPPYKYTSRYIVDIVSKGYEESQCIAVSDPSQLYITDDYIVTHNTSLARAVATATGRDFFYLNCGSLQKPKSVLIGSMQAKDGSTFLVESEFMTYYKSDRPTLIFLDELSRISSQGANELMTITDREESYIYAPELGKRISKGKDVVFCAAANFGIQYSDTRKLDMALLNRFIPFHQNYLSSEDETKLLNMKVPNLNQLELASLIKQANLLRDNFDILQIEVSHRNMIDFARYMGAGFPFKVIQRELLINLFLNGSDDKRDVADQILNGKQI